MDITPPYGYQEVVPLTKEHRVVLPAAGMLPQPSGPVRDSSGAPSAAPEQGVNLRSSFRAQ